MVTVHAVNVGIMGHVDSGKTSLLRALFTMRGGVVSTAALDKHPQSQERGITLDLGFSSLDLPLVTDGNHISKMARVCFVDCPGHASLIRAVLGAAQIIDRIVLVVDVTKGIQTQTLECLVLAEIVTSHLIVVLNKIDLIPSKEREAKTRAMARRCKEAITEKMRFGANVDVVCTAASPEPPHSNEQNHTFHPWGLDAFLETLRKSINADLPRRVNGGPLLFLYDHAFTRKGEKNLQKPTVEYLGHGTVVTGTVVSGMVKVHQDVCFATNSTARHRIRSIQSFREQVPELKQGDRGGLCLNSADATGLERGLIIDPRRPLHPLIDLIAVVRRVPQFKGKVASNSKYHVTCMHATVTATLIFFQHCNAPEPAAAYDLASQNNVNVTLSSGHLLASLPMGQWSDMCSQFMYLAELEGAVQNKNTQKVGMESSSAVFALVRLDRELLCPLGALLLGSKLDLDQHSTSECRIAFFGSAVRPLGSQFGEQAEYTSNIQPGLPVTSLYIARLKSKTGTVLRVVDDGVIGTSMFESREHVTAFLGFTVRLEPSGIIGKIERPFGKSGKFFVAVAASREDEGVQICLDYVTNVLGSSKHRIDARIFLENRSAPITSAHQ